MARRPDARGRSVGAGGRAARTRGRQRRYRRARWRFADDPGERPYEVPSDAQSQQKRYKRVRGGGFEDARGNVWKPARPEVRHGGPHYEVQHPGRSKTHTNVAPDGDVIGKDRFPYKRRR